MCVDYKDCEVILKLFFYVWRGWGVDKHYTEISGLIKKQNGRGDKNNHFPFPWAGTITSFSFIAISLLGKSFLGTM